MKTKILFIAFILSFSLSMAQKGKVQSTIVYHFTKYMEWPSSKKSGDFIICVYGKHESTDYLKQLASSKMAGTQKIVIKECNSLSELKESHIILVGDNKLSDLDNVNAVAKSSSSVVITEKDGLGTKGAGINFIENSGKVSFEINESAILKFGVKVDSKLSSLGIKVG